ncbi:MAG: AAA family ATPase [Candidatus Sericytochromatia bacterium]|nr:AAA family ATPase [Candidatus Sericytochromatia bacterium]
MQPGELIANRFKIIDELGTGAMGVVWLVEDVDTAQRVALKQVSTHLGDEGALRFKQEFRLMTQLRHPNCCQVHEYGQLEDGTPFFTMEVVPGHGLDERIPFEPAAVLRLLPSLLAALGHVHELGFVHRDLKSQNVRIKPDGTVKLMDFGLIEYAGTRDLPIAGTLGYLAPEIVLKGEVDGRADLYAIGALIFELVTGRLPFTYDSRAEMLRAHVHEAPPELRRLVPDCDPVLDRVVRKLLAKAPSDRFQSTEEVLSALGFEAGRASRSLLSPPLIGREHESSLLQRAVERMMDGQAPPTILLEGPPGIGKTRLLREFRAGLQVDGIVPVVTGAGRGEDSTPYAPFREVLRGLVPALKEHIPERLEVHASVLSSILPELSQASTPEMDDPAKEKLRLMAAIGDLFASLAARRSFVVILEDWHLADPLSRDLLDYLQRNLAQLPLLRVVATRHREHLQGEWVAHVENVKIAALGDNEIAQMVARILGNDALVAPLLRPLAELTEGNPYHVQRLLEHLVRERLITPGMDGWLMDAPLQPGALPRNLQGLLLRKMAQLPEDAITVARIGAVLGRGFDLALLGELTGFGEERLFDALESLERQQVLELDDDNHYDWSQAIFKEVVYESFTPEHRTAMHARVAAVLEKRIGKGKLREAPFDLIKGVADHYTVGCRPDKIVTFALEVGRRSAMLFANREAERYLSTAVTLLQADGDPRWDKPRLLALRLLGDTRRMSADIAGAKHCYLEAIPLAQRVGASMYLARMLTSLADCYTSEDNLAEALGCCERSLEVSLRSGDQASAARCYLTSSMLRYMQGNLAQSVVHAEEALHRGREVDDRGVVAEALAFIGHLYVATMPENAYVGIAHLEEAVQLLDELGHKVGLQNAYNFLGAAFFKLGEFRKAENAFRLNRNLAFELGLREEEAFAHLNLAITNYELGEFDLGLVEAESADALAAEAQMHLVHALAITFKAPGYAHLGRLREASKALAEAEGLFRASANKMLEARVLEHRMALLLYLGRAADALETADGLLDLLKLTGNTEPEGHVLAMRAEAKARMGNLAGAQRDLETAWAKALEGGAQALMIHVHRERAWIALREEHYEKAKLEVEAGLVLAEKTDAILSLCDLLGLLGETRLALGDSEAAMAFQRLTELASHSGSRLQEALGYFGQAASRPYDPEAKRHAERAQQLVHSMVAGLDGEAVKHFWNPIERQRVMQGNYIDFSLSRKRAQTPQGPIGLPFGMNKF